MSAACWLLLGAYLGGVLVLLVQSLVEVRSLSGADRQLLAPRAGLGFWGLFAGALLLWPLALVVYWFEQKEEKRDDDTTF